jgi:glycosyltransferase involved in cell wall biosynthesis
MKLLFNVGVFGKHGVEHALVNLLPQIKIPNVKLIIHEIYEPDNRSPLLEKIKIFTTQICSLPRTSFWGNIHMNRRKNILFKLIDGLGIFSIHTIVANQINKLNVDIIVDYDLSLLRSVHKLKSPVIGVFHFRPKNFRSGNAAKLKRIGRRLTGYDKLIVLCPEMFIEACEVWPFLSDKFIVMPNSIDIFNINENSKKLIQLPPGIEPEKYFLTIARLTHQKNINLMLDAFDMAKSRGCDWKLIVIGEGEDKPSLLCQVEKLGLTASVEFIGYQANPYPYIKMAGAFVSSSREEGFPVSLIEALTLMCPIISLACPTGPKDILENGSLGKLLDFTQNDPNELAHAMYEISTNSKLIESYKNEMQKNVDKYSSVKIGNEFTNLILSYQRQ